MAEAEALQKSAGLMYAYNASIVLLKTAGAMSTVVNIQNDIRKERRRQRSSTIESPVVADALRRNRDAEESLIRHQRLEAVKANATALTNAKVKQDLNQSRALLKRKQSDILELESLLAEKHALKRFSPALLGQGLTVA